VKPSGPSPLYRFAWIFYLVLALGGVLWLGFEHGTISPDLFFDPSGWWLDLGLGLACGGLLIGLWQFGRRHLPAARELERELRRRLGELTVSEALALALISGFAEELFFRGAVLDAWGWIAATALFALLHSGPRKAFRLWMIFAGLAALSFAGLTLWRGNLLPAIVAHVTVNAINLGHMAAEQPAVTPPGAGSA